MPVRVLAAAMFAVSSLPAEAAVTLLGGGPPGSIAEAIAAAVPGALPAGHPVVVEKPAPDASPLDALEHGRAAAAVLHGDIFRNAAKRSSAIADLEYFPLRRACFVLLVPIDSAADASALLAASAALPAGPSISAAPDRSPPAAGRCFRLPIRRSPRSGPRRAGACGRWRACSTSRSRRYCSPASRSCRATSRPMP